MVAGPDFDTGEMKETTLVLPIEGDASGADRLAASGLLLMIEEGVARMDEPMFGTPFADSLTSFDFYGDQPVFLKSVKAPASQLPKEMIFLPAFALLALIAFLQMPRARAQKGVPA